MLIKYMNVLAVFILFILIGWIVWSLLQSSIIVEGARVMTTKGGVDTVHMEEVNPVETNRKYVDRKEEVRALILMLNNPAMSDINKIKFLLSPTTSKFTLRNDPEFRQPINNLQSCIKNNLVDLQTFLNKIRQNRPKRVRKTDQVCKGNTCERFDRADKMVKKLSDLKTDYIAQLEIVLAPEFSFKNDPELSNPISSIKRCIITNLASVLTSANKSMYSIEQGGSANLAILKFKDKTMFGAAAMRATKEHDKNNTIPEDVGVLNRGLTVQRKKK